MTEWRLKRPHRLARICYFPRVFGFYWSFVVVMLLTLERDFSWTIIPSAVVSFLLWPHLAYLHACLAPVSKIAEQRNL
jgi:hypothetical protein